MNASARRRFDIHRVHSLTGVLPLGVWLAFHLWETSAAAGGRVPFADRAVVASGRIWVVVLEVLLVLVPLAVHAATGLVIGVRRARARAEGGEGGEARDPDARGRRLLLLATGVLALAFIVVHLGHTWLPSAAGHADAMGLYDRLRETLGRPVYLAVYVVGITAVCYHLGDGLGSVPGTLWPDGPASRLRAARIGGAVLGIVLWVVAMNTTSHFATGRALFFDHSGASTHVETGRAH